MKTKKKSGHRTQAKPSVVTASTAMILARDAKRISTQLAKRVDAALVHTSAPAEAPLVLGEEATLGALGLVEIKLTEKEELVLSRSVRVSDVLIKPTGQPYVSHPTYTKWFNEAFGRLGWAIVPRSKPMRAGNAVVCHYLLYIHGQPAAFATGEQEYFDNNKEQTFGDAVEATVASALRRCAKRLGVGLELWDKRFLNDFIAEHCIKVWRGDQSRPQWRLKTDPPFWDERTRKDGDDERGTQDMHKHEARPLPPAAREHAAGNDRTGDEVISEKQVGRLIAISRNARRSEEEVKRWLEERYRIKSRRAVPRRLYDEICNWLAAPGPLPSSDL